MRYYHILDIGRLKPKHVNLTRGGEIIEIVEKPTFLFGHGRVVESEGLDEPLNPFGHSLSRF
jgi:hypothetical protein